MRFYPTPLSSAFVIELEKKGDERGFFARAFCEKEFAMHGLPTHFVQMNNSFSAEKGTLRGLHYQVHPMEEIKVIRCIRGSFWDVILDIREGSPTFGHHFGVILSAENRNMMVVPKGFAHGFITLEDDTEAFYMVSQFYSPDYERGIRWNDLQFNIAWPIDPTVISDKDGKHKNFDSRESVKCIH